jgi:hypothetical protein
MGVVGPTVCGRGRAACGVVIAGTRVLRRTSLRCVLWIGPVVARGREGVHHGP